MLKEFTEKDLRRLEFISAMLQGCIRCWGFILTAIMYLAVNQLANAQQFESSGKLTYTAFSGNREVFKVRKGFTVRVRECGWLIKVWNLNTTDNPEDPYEYYEISAFGNDVIVFPSPRDPSKTPGPRITPTRAPIVDSSQSHPIWLAFASMCYLRQITNGFVQPMWIMNNDLLIRSNILCKASWEASKSPPFLLTKMSFFSDGKWYPPLGPMIAHSYVHPYSLGFTQAVYSATEFTNFANLSIPSKFSYVLFGPKLNGQAVGELDTIATWEAWVENVSATISDTNVLPKISRLSVVDDKRFWKDLKYLGSIDYPLTNHWVSKDEPSLVKIAALYKNIKPITKDEPTKSRVFIRWFLLGISILGIVTTMILLKTGRKDKS